MCMAWIVARCHGWMWWATLEEMAYDCSGANAATQPIVSASCLSNGGSVEGSRSPWRAGGLMRERGEPAWCVPTWRASRDCLMGVQLGFMGVQLGGKVIWAGLRGCGCGVG